MSAGVQVQLTMVLYDQREYNRARRWRLPKCTLSPGEYQARAPQSSPPWALGRGASPLAQRKSRLSRLIALHLGYLSSSRGMGQGQHLT